MTQLELLQTQLQLALGHHRLASWIKRSNADYPGYWLFIIEEQLDKADRVGILSALKCSAKMATIYKLTFAHRIACMLSEAQP